MVLLLFFKNAYGYRKIIFFCEQFNIFLYILMSRNEYLVLIRYVNEVYKSNCVDITPTVSQ